jgi:hypothetical protein
LKPNAKLNRQGCSSFYVEGVREELDSDEEYYYDRKANALLFYPNHTLPAEQQLPNTGLTAVTMEQIISIRGTQVGPRAILPCLIFGLVTSPLPKS